MVWREEREDISDVVILNNLKNKSMKSKTP